jgi:hypothetical protein
MPIPFEAVLITRVDRGDDVGIALEVILDREGPIHTGDGYAQLRLVDYVEDSDALLYIVSYYVP